jgi:hypothetical protein
MDKNIKANIKDIKRQMEGKQSMAKACGKEHRVLRQVRKKGKEVFGIQAPCDLSSIPKSLA